MTHRALSTLAWVALAIGVEAASPARSVILAAQSAEPARVALINVTLIDGTGAAGRPGTTILLNGDRIEAVFRTGAEVLPPGTQTVDLTGRFVIPGLVNTHFHLPMLGMRRDPVLDGLERMFYAGVTSLREMSGDTRLSAGVVRSGLLGDRAIPNVYYAARVAGPTLYASGAGSRFTAGYAPGTAPWEQAVHAGTDIVRAVAMAAGTGATGLKIYADLDTALVRRLIAEAHRQGLETWAHGTIFPTGPLEAVRLGIDGLSHACYLFWGMQDDVPQKRSDRRPFDPGAVDPNGEPYQTLFREMAARGTVLDATAHNTTRHPGAAAAGCVPDLLRETLLAARRAGVLMSTGTDYSISDGEPDPTLFREIESLVETGVFSPLEAISASTLNGARAIGIEESYGTIEPGKIADFVILTADPTDDIAALQRVEAVVKSGRIYQRNEYEERSSERR